MTERTSYGPSRVPAVRDMNAASLTEEPVAGTRRYTGDALLRAKQVDRVHSGQAAVAASSADDARARLAYFIEMKVGILEVEGD